MMASSPDITEGDWVKLYHDHAWYAGEVEMPVALTRKQERVAFLERHREVIQAHMGTRAQDVDWHGVSDDANDLREVDAELRGLRFKDE